MNDLMLNLGLVAWKPIVGSLLLPPVPLLLLVLLGVRLLFSRPLLGWLLLLGSLGMLWLFSTKEISRQLTLHLLKPAPQLTVAAIKDLKAQPRTAIVVLGGGRRSPSSEYGGATLNARSVERLRYGIWLARETGLPLAFSGGLGHGSNGGPTEAELAARIAEQEFKYPLRWTETQSRDTYENARRSVTLLQDQGIERIVLVTHAFHMPRAQRNFEKVAAARSDAKRMQILPAPLARPEAGPTRVLYWLPSARGLEENHLIMHEWLGLLLGA